MNEYRISDLSVGLQASFEVEVTNLMFDQFLAMSGDNNPLHLDPTFAKERGFKDRVAYGLMTSSFYSKLAGVYLPGKNAVLHGIDITFRKPAFSSDRLQVEGTISFINEAYGQIEIKASITNGNGELISKAKIKVGLSV